MQPIDGLQIKRKVRSGSRLHRYKEFKQEWTLASAWVLDLSWTMWEQEQEQEQDKFRSRTVAVLKLQQA